MHYFGILEKKRKFIRGGAMFNLLYYTSVRRPNLPFITHPRPSQYVIFFSKIISMTKSFGYRTDNKSFDGMAGDLERRVIDYGSSPLIVRSDRAEILSYGHRMWILR